MQLSSVDFYTEKKITHAIKCIKKKKKKLVLTSTYVVYLHLHETIKDKGKE